MAADFCKPWISFIGLFALITLTATSLPAISQAAETEASGKNWKAKLRTIYVYDSNVVQEPEDKSLRPANLVGDSDSIFEWAGTTTYTYKYNNNFKVLADYDIDMSVHSELSQYDLTSQMFGIKPVYKLTRLMNVSLRYFYIWNLVEYENFSGINYINPSFNHMHEKFGLTRLSYNFKKTNNFKNNLRDATQHGMGIDQIFFFSNYTRTLSIGYKYSKEDSKGTAFDRDIHDIKVSAKSPLLWGIDLKAKYKFSFRKYNSRLSSNDVSKREDQQHTYSFDLQKMLADKWNFLHKLTANVKYTQVINETNLEVREYRSSRLDLGLQAKF